MTEGNIFSLFTPGGVYPIVPNWGVPYPSQPGYPHPSIWLTGVPPSSWWGTPIWPMGGISSSWWMGGGTPHWDWMGVPPWGLGGVLPTVRTGWGYPPVRIQSSRASTCYVADGLPLAFTQEDFLVTEKIISCCPLLVDMQIFIGQKQLGDWMKRWEFSCWEDKTKDPRVMSIVTCKIPIFSITTYR